MTSEVESSLAACFMLTELCDQICSPFDAVWRWRKGLLNYRQLSRMYHLRIKTYISVGAEFSSPKPLFKWKYVKSKAAQIGYAGWIILVCSLLLKISSQPQLQNCSIYLKIKMSRYAGVSKMLSSHCQTSYENSITDLHNLTTS